MKTTYHILLLGLFVTFLSCSGGGPSGYPDWRPNESVKSPVYVKPGPIELKEAEHFRNLGKIYYQPPFLFLNEKSKGLHVIDNSDPANPKKIKFIKIPGNLDLAMKGQYLYINHIRDLVLLRIDHDKVVELQRLRNTFSDALNDYPSDYRGYFICPDPEKGQVMFWKNIIASDEPNCRI